MMTMMVQEELPPAHHLHFIDVAGTMRARWDLLKTSKGCLGCPALGDRDRDRDREGGRTFLTFG